MSLQNYFIPFDGPSGPGMLHFGLGQKYPLPLMKGDAGASLNTVVDGSMLFLNVAMPHPRPSEILPFHQGIRFGIYDGPDMPGGLVLTQISTSSKEEGLILECPFNAAKLKRICPGSLGRFWTSNKIDILATFTDTSTPDLKVVAMRMMEMPPAVVAKLRVLWKGQGLMTTYESHYLKLARKKSIPQLWAEAHKF